MVSVEGNGVEGAASGPYTDNQAAPLSLYEFAPDGTSARDQGGLPCPSADAFRHELPRVGRIRLVFGGNPSARGNGEYLTVGIWR